VFAHWCRQKGKARNLNFQGQKRVKKSSIAGKERWSTSIAWNKIRKFY